jgi:hypothetical protein
MEGNTLLPGSLDELKAAHPNVTTRCDAYGTWYATVRLDCGYAEMHDDSEAVLLARLTAALGG